MVPNWNIGNPVQAMCYCTLFPGSDIGKMIVGKISPENPPSVFVAVLIFSPTFELPVYESSHF